MPCSSCGQNVAGFSASRSKSMILGNARTMRSGKSRNVIRNSYGVVSRNVVSNGKKIFLLR